MLFDIKKNQWSKEMLHIFKVPEKILPVVKDSADDFGQTTKFGSNIPIQGIAGDQQAATIGQACLEPGSIKSTYGTGCFMIMNVGSKLKYSKKLLPSVISTVIDKFLLLFLPETKNLFFCIGFFIF